MPQPDSLERVGAVSNCAATADAGRLNDGGGPGKKHRQGWGESLPVRVPTVAATVKLESRLACKTTRGFVARRDMRENAPARWLFRADARVATFHCRWRKSSAVKKPAECWIKEKPAGDGRGRRCPASRTALRQHAGHPTHEQGGTTKWGERKGGDAYSLAGEACCSR